MSNIKIPTLHPIAKLILDHVASSTTLEEYRRAVQVAERAISRLPDEDTALMPGICAAYNVAYLSCDAYVARLEGSIDWALRLEDSRDRIIEDPMPHY